MVRLILIGLFTLLYSSHSAAQLKGEYTAILDTKISKKEIHKIVQQVAIYNDSIAKIYNGNFKVIYYVSIYLSDTTDIKKVWSKAQRKIYKQCTIEFSPSKVIIDKEIHKITSFNVSDKDHIGIITNWVSVD